MQIFTATLFWEEDYKKKKKQLETTLVSFNGRTDKQTTVHP